LVKKKTKTRGGTVRRMTMASGELTVKRSVEPMRRGKGPHERRATRRSRASLGEKEPRATITERKNIAGREGEVYRRSSILGGGGKRQTAQKRNGQRNSSITGKTKAGDSFQEGNSG